MQKYKSIINAKDKKIKTQVMAIMKANKNPTNTPLSPQSFKVWLSHLANSRWQKRYSDLIDP